MQTISDLTNNTSPLQLKGNNLLPFKNGRCKKARTDGTAAIFEGTMLLIKIRAQRLVFFEVKLYPEINSANLTDVAEEKAFKGNPRTVSSKKFS